MTSETRKYEASTDGLRELVLVVTDDDRRTVPLRGRRLTIGRDASNDVVLDDRYVSGRHCRVEEVAGVYRVEDLGSSNGTRLNGVRVEQGYLDAGDHIGVGRAVLVCVDLHGDRSTSRGTGGLVGASIPMRQVLRFLSRFASRETPVLVEGETGTGKELAAHAVHQLSRRRDKPFVAVNCGALSPELVMSELFGHEAGSFTGAMSRHRGAFEQAGGGTLFLDEVGELPLVVQAALLRVLETGCVRRVGAERETTTDVRLVAATNRELMAEVRRGRFRQDLYHRLAVLRVRMPALRERPDDLPELARVLLERSGSRQVLSDDALAVLRGHDWAGNVRELRNVLEHASAMAEGDTITARDICFDTAAATPSQELTVLQQAIVHHGSIAAAARELGLPRTTLRDRLYRLGGQAHDPG
jgi:DNA-binding NtrC family response regulator